MRTTTGTVPVAIFDLDRTLIPGSSLVPLARQLVRRGLLPRRRLAGAVARNAHFARRGATTDTAERILADALAAAAGAPVAELRGAVFDAAEEIVRSLRPGVHQLVRRHAAAGDLCVLLSASPHELVQEVARRADLDVGIGTRVEVRDRMLTGRLDGPFCHGDGKLARLRDELRVDLRRATAYTDAASDLPLLRACAHPVAVRPDHALEAVARLEGWPIVAG
jgi:HAD superfamily hydrolase (TIGR01490 family)